MGFKPLIIRSVSVQVLGRVQGVGFRYSALNAARSLDLRGWVRNDTDGSVSARIEGHDSDVDQFLSWLKKGPPFSSVHNVIVTEMNPDSSLTSFHVTN